MSRTYEITVYRDRHITEIYKIHTTADSYDEAVDKSKHAVAGHVLGAPSKDDAQVRIYDSPEDEETIDHDGNNDKELIDGVWHVVSPVWELSAEDRQKEG